MFKNKTPDGRNNVSGVNIRRLRKAKAKNFSQRMLAYEMQLHGIDLEKNAIQRIESGARFVTDIELIGFSKVFGVPVDVLLETGDHKNSESDGEDPDPNEEDHE